MMCVHVKDRLRERIEDRIQDLMAEEGIEEFATWFDLDVPVEEIINNMEGEVYCQVCEGHYDVEDANDDDV